MIKLLGLLLVAIGFAFRWNTLGVVLAGGIVTGLVAGLSLREILEMIGRFFTDNRGLVLPVIMMLPVVGVLEKHGLQERVAALIRRARAATAGRVLWLYQALRGVSSVFGLSIGNHASMVRPLVAPMAEGAAGVPLRPEGDAPAAAAAGPDAAKSSGDEEAGRRNTIRAHAAAAENVGNFFSDDIVVAVGALLLIEAFFRNAGVDVPLRDIKLWSLPTAAWVLVVGWWRYRVLDRRLRTGRGAKAAGAKDGEGGAA